MSKDKFAEFCNSPPIAFSNVQDPDSWNPDPYITASHDWSDVRLHCNCGREHVLTLWERLSLRAGLTDIETLNAKYRTDIPNRG